MAFARALTGRDDPRAREVDDALHPSRLPLGAGRPTGTTQASELPDGAFVRRDGAQWLVSAGAMLRWSLHGYGPAVALPAGRLDVLTPEPTTHALSAGFRARLHPHAIG